MLLRRFLKKLLAQGRGPGWKKRSTAAEAQNDRGRRLSNNDGKTDGQKGDRDRRQLQDNRQKLER